MTEPEPTIILAADRPLIWLNVAYILIVPMIVVPASIVWLATHGITAFQFLVAASLWWATGLAITAGYHRLFSHRGYRASAPVRLFFAIFGAMAGQNSAIAWCSDHRRHHQYTDTDKDPYCAKNGFWYSHIGWILRGSVWGDDHSNVPDLVADPILAWQHRNWLLIALIGNVGIVLPLALLTEQPVGMVLLAGFLRVTVVQHFTFFINSFAHMIGDQPWSPKNSSRDNWFLSFLTFGEGFHNFHHTFEADYRNGVRWFHWDPSKWLIFTLSRFGLAHDLRRTPDWILLRTRYEKRRESLLGRFGAWGEEKRTELRAKHESLVAGRNAVQESLRGELEAAEARVQDRINELKARSHDWTRKQRDAWNAASSDLREAAELELRELDFAMAETRRSATKAIARWDRLMHEYVEQYGVPTPMAAPTAG